MGLSTTVLGFLAPLFALRRTAEPRYGHEDARVPRVVRTLAGVPVTPDTALANATTWACLRYLSQTVAMPPWRVFRETPSGGELVPSHPVDYLIRKRPSPEWGSFAFRETMLHWALRWGNAYAEIERDLRGIPIALHPIHPERVEVCRDMESGELFYRVSNGHAGSTDVGMLDMFHLRGFGEGPVGLNVVTYAAQSLGWARAVQLFGATFFGNGANISGVVSYKRPLKPDGKALARAEFEALYGGPRNANKVAFLDDDATFKEITIAPDKGQFIETNQFLVEEACRWWGVPPHKVMHLLRATNNNIEHQSIEVVGDSIAPWAKRFEEEADYKLFGANRPGFYTRMDMRELLRGDAAARAAYYKIMREMGVFSVNDILRAEDMNTIGSDGDLRVMQGQYVRLDEIATRERTAAGPADQTQDSRP